MKPLHTGATEFAIEFYNEVQELGSAVEARLRAEAESRLQALQKDHADLAGAAVALERPAERASAYLYRAQVVVYMRPDNLAGVAQRDTPEGALKEALSAVERLIHEKRES